LRIGNESVLHGGALATHAAHVPQVSKKKSPLIMRGAFAYSAVKYFAQRQSGTTTYKANKRGCAAVRASVVCANEKYANGLPSLLE
jgi:hypothetical protein